MIGIDDLISSLEQISSGERESMICSVLEQVLKNRINNPALRDSLRKYYKEQRSEELFCRDPKEIMDEFCDIYGFGELIDELNNRIEDEYGSSNTPTF